MYHIGTGVLSGRVESYMTHTGESHGSMQHSNGYWRVQNVSEKIPGVPNRIQHERVGNDENACITMDPQAPSLNPWNQWSLVG